MMKPVKRDTVIQSLIVSFVFLTLLFPSCENKIDNIPQPDLLTLPSLTSRDSEIIYKDSGMVQLVMSFPLIEQYSNTDSPYSEFTDGLVVSFFDGQKDPVGSVSAKYAKYTDSDNLWLLKDSVTVINENNDKLETEVLYWDQEKDLIYTDRFVKITNEDQIIQGFGFESDSRLNNRWIKKVSATIYISDEE